MSGRDRRYRYIGGKGGRRTRRHNPSPSLQVNGSNGGSVLDPSDFFSGIDPLAEVCDPHLPDPDMPNTDSSCN